MGVQSLTFARRIGIHKEVYCTLHRNHVSMSSEDREFWNDIIGDDLPQTWLRHRTNDHHCMQKVVMAVILPRRFCPGSFGSCELCLNLTGAPKKVKMLPLSDKHHYHQHLPRAILHGTDGGNTSRRFTNSQADYWEHAFCCHLDILCRCASYDKTEKLIFHSCDVDVRFQNSLPITPQRALLATRKANTVKRSRETMAMIFCALKEIWFR